MTGDEGEVEVNHGRDGDGGGDRRRPDLAAGDLPVDRDASTAFGRDVRARAGNASDSDEPFAPPRPLIERLGMAAIALVLAALFGAMAAAAFSGGEPFLGVMAATGTLMTLWVGALTLRRG